MVGSLLMGVACRMAGKFRGASTADERLPSAEDEIGAVSKGPIFFSDPELADWTVKLRKLLEEKRPYLQAGLRLEDLARELGLKPYQVSEILNLGVGSTFYDHINGLRIEEAKRRLRDPNCAHMNILGIATDSGFNSKSVFNKTFREHTGMTPSKFRVNGHSLGHKPEGPEPSLPHEPRSGDGDPLYPPISPPRQ